MLKSGMYPVFSSLFHGGKLLPGPLETGAGCAPTFCVRPIAGHRTENPRAPPQNRQI